MLRERRRVPELVSRVGVEVWQGTFGLEGARGRGHLHIIERASECTAESSEGITKTLPPAVHTSEECEHDGMQQGRCTLTLIL